MGIIDCKLNVHIFKSLHFITLSQLNYPIKPKEQGASVSDWG